MLLPCHTEAGSNSEWWSTLNRNAIAGPDGPQPPVRPGKKGIGYDLMGEEGYPRYVEDRKAERQRGGLSMDEGIPISKQHRAFLPSAFGHAFLQRIQCHSFGVGSM
eukprot:1160499-Pelagomonas_calceolata.AAC.5